MGKATLNDIAKALGISLGTVDRALHNRGQIRESTRRKVLETAAQLGYEVNTLASTLSRKRKIRFAALVTLHAPHFYRVVLDGIAQAVKELTDFGVELIGIESVEEPFFAERLMEYAKDDLDGVIMNAGTNIMPASAFEVLAQKGVPVIAVSTDNPQSRRKSVVCADPMVNGRMAGELMAYMLGFCGEVAVVTGSHNVEDHKLKIEGFTQSIRTYAPKMRIVGIAESNESSEIALECVRDIFKAHPSLSGLYFNTANYLGIERLLASKPDALKIIATDIFAESEKMLRRGVIDALMFQDPFRHGYDAVNLLYNFVVKRLPIPEFSYFRPEIIMKSNIESYLAGSR